MKFYPPRLLVLDDYEGQLAASPAMMRLRELADVTILDRPLEPADRKGLKEFQVILALRERTRLDERFFADCPKLELVLQTGGHAYHIEQVAATSTASLSRWGGVPPNPLLPCPSWPLPYYWG